MRALGLVNRTVREINEMRYEFDEPFIVDSSRAETELGLRAAPLADAVEQTVRWYRAQTAPRSAAEQRATEQVAPGVTADLMDTTPTETVGGAGSTMAAARGRSPTTTRRASRRHENARITKT